MTQRSAEDAALHVTSEADALDLTWGDRPGYVVG